MPDYTIFFQFQRLHVRVSLERDFRYSKCMGGQATFTLREEGKVGDEAALVAPLTEQRPRARPAPKPTAAQRRYLNYGVDQAGGKLPLFDLNGQEIDRRTIRACIEHGWAEPWFPNPVKPDWVVCRITDLGRQIVGGKSGPELAL